MSEQEITPKENNGKSKKAMLGFTLLLLIIGLVWFCLWFFHFRFYEYTDDAYANGNKIAVNAIVPGTVTAFFADDTDLVEKGQLLATLDPTDYALAYAGALETYKATILQVRQLYERVTALEAALESRLIALKQARYDLENRQNLVDAEAVSNEEFVHARDTFSASEAAVKQAESELKSAVDALGGVPIEQHPTILTQRSEVKRAYYNLFHTRIIAPYRGYIAQRSVNVGERVSNNTRLLAIIPTEGMWVDANYKETQLTNMRIGQPATVRIDLYGSGIKFEGKVAGIASGSGSVFSLIPPQNATGNWIKIVQRLPVRIELNPDQLKDYPLRLGISADVDVDISDTDLPMLAKRPTEKIIASTDVYEIDMTPIDALLDELLTEE